MRPSTASAKVGRKPASVLPDPVSAISKAWEPLRAERVVEVAYDHLQGSRFRHATTFQRWRPDKPPEACRYDQLETTAPFELEAIFG